MNKIELGIYKTKPKLLIYKFRLYIGGGKDILSPNSEPEIKLDLWLETTGFTGVRYFGLKDNGRFPWFIRSARISFTDNKITRKNGEIINADNISEVLEIVREKLQIPA